MSFNILTKPSCPCDAGIQSEACNYCVIPKLIQKLKERLEKVIKK